MGYYVFRYRRDVVAQNLANAFPEKSESERASIARQFYKNLCDYPAETLKLITISKEELSRRLVFKNPEALERYFKKGISYVCLTIHQFNWEFLINGLVLLGYHPMYYVYQTQSSERSDRFSNAARQRFGSRGIRRDQTARETLKLRRSLHGLAIVADQYPGHAQDKKYWTTFMNQETAFFQGIQPLAALSGGVVLFFAMKRERRGYFSCEIIQLADPPHDKNGTDIVEKYVRTAEQTIRRQPDGYLWSHKRWKHKRADVEAAN